MNLLGLSRETANSIFFYWCFRCVDNGKNGLTRYDFTCSEGTAWSSELTTCDYEANVNCSSSSSSSNSTTTQAPPPCNTTESSTTTTTTTTTTPKSTTTTKSTTRKGKKYSCWAANLKKKLICHLIKSIIIIIAI